MAPEVLISVSVPIIVLPEDVTYPAPLVSWLLLVGMVGLPSTLSHSVTGPFAERVASTVANEVTKLISQLSSYASISAVYPA